MSGSKNSLESHKCVFCSELFSTKNDYQSHFRRHASGEIDIKGRPKVPQKPPDQLEPGRAIPKDPGRKEAGTVVGAGRGDGASCDVCGEVFRTVSLAISHKFRKHPESVQKHYCPHCGMMFPIKVNRDKHVATHPEPPPQQRYPCLCCGVEFYSPRARKFHLESVHKGAVRMVDPIKTPAPSMKIVVNNAGEANSVYYCHLCGCEYQVKYNLQKHLSTKHTQEERQGRPQELVQCNLCSAMFYTKRAYEAHNHHHREGDMFATNEFMRQQVVQRIDQDFDQRRVPTTVERYLSASAVSSNRSSTWRTIQAARRGARHRCDQPQPSPSLSPAIEENCTGCDGPSDGCPAEDPCVKEQFCDNDCSSKIIILEEVSSEALASLGSVPKKEKDSSEFNSLNSTLTESRVKQIMPECDDKGANCVDLESRKWKAEMLPNSVERFKPALMWDSGEEEKRARWTRRMIDNPEEDDSDISSLGTVDPNTLMSNSVVLAKKVTGGSSSYVVAPLDGQEGRQPTRSKEKEPVKIKKSPLRETKQIEEKNDECDSGELEVKVGTGAGPVIEWYDTQAEEVPRIKRCKSKSVNIPR